MPTTTRSVACTRSRRYYNCAARAEPLAEPRDLVPHIIDALQSAFGSRLHAVLLAGSVAKDDWIPFWSDLDLHVFVEAHQPSGLEPSDTFTIQQALSKIDRSDYGLAALQLLAFDQEGYPAWFPAPWPDTSETAWGTPPSSPKLRDLEKAYRARAEDTLVGLNRALSKVSESWTCSLDDDLPELVYRLGSVLKDSLFSAGILLVGPRRALTAHRDELVKVVGQGVGNVEDARTFYEFAQSWREVKTNPASLRQMFQTGHRVISAIASWAKDRFQGARIGQRIVELRRRKGWSQTKLAEEAGVSEDSVGLVEGPDYALPKEPRYPLAIEQIAKALQKPLVDLLTLRSDAEIAGSYFAHLLRDIQRRRIEMEEAPGPSNDALTQGP